MKPTSPRHMLKPRRYIGTVSMADPANEPYTRIPNALLDDMANLGNAELRVMFAIIRKTAGWGKACDVISVSQLATLTGLTSRNTQRAIEALLSRGFITRERSGKQNYCYTVKPYPVGTRLDHIPSDPISLGDTDPYPVGTRLEEKPYPLGITQKKRSKEKKEKIVGAPQAAQPTSEHQRLMALYAEALPDKRIPNGAQEGKAAKAILAAGYTPEQAMQVYQYLKRRDFYADQHLSLTTVNKQMGAVLDAIRRGVPAGNRNGHAPEPRRPVITNKPSISPDANSPAETARKALEYAARRKAGKP